MTPWPQKPGWGLETTPCPTLPQCNTQKPRPRILLGCWESPSKLFQNSPLFYMPPAGPKGTSAQTSDDCVPSKHSKWYILPFHWMSICFLLALIYSLPPIIHWCCRNWLEELAGRGWGSPIVTRDSKQLEQKGMWGRGASLFPLAHRKEHNNFGVATLWALSYLRWGPCSRLVSMQKAFIYSQHARPKWAWCVYMTQWIGQDRQTAWCIGRRMSIST